MKILTISNLYPPNIVGGYEVLCFEVMRGLAEKGHEINVLTSDYGGKQAIYPNQQVQRLLTLLATEGNIYKPLNISAIERNNINQKNLQTLSRTLDEINPDLIFIWNLHFFDVSLLDALSLVKKKQVYLLSDNWLINFYNSDFVANYFSREVYVKRDRWYACWHRFKSRLFNGQKKRSMLGYAIFASRFMQNLYSRAGFEFANSKIIYHGISSGVEESLPFAKRETFIANDELRLLFAGRVVDIKGVHTAIEAMPHIINALPNLKISLSIVGDMRDQQYVANLKKIIAELGVEERVCFIPPVEESKLFGLFQDYDIYLFPSLYEPFSLTLIHALRAGIPTIASDVGGNPEIVFHEQTGLLFRPADARHLAAQVVKFVHNKNLRVTVSSGARDHANQFTFNRMINQIEDYLLYSLESNQ